jgi:hypothetical protein
VGNLTSIGFAGNRVRGVGPQNGVEEAITKYVSGPIGLVQNAIVLVCSILVIVGSQKMKNLQSYGWAMTSSILTVIPCFACCLWGIPIGIWALIVLNKPEVKSAFG